MLFSLEKKQNENTMPYKLSFLIPANTEEFLKNTVEDILANTSEETEVIVGLDGKWSNPPLLQHPRVSVIYSPVTIGQRKMTNLCARLSKAKYVCKADAHTAYDKDFDKKMFEAFEKAGDNAVIIPIMKNLHVYDFKCYKCGYKVYQDVKPICPGCVTTMKKKLVWKPRRGTNSRAYCFDSEPHFQYFNEYTQRDEYKKDLEETGLTQSMSIQGSFYMMTREKYMAMAESREELGSWGGEGISIACRFWLSGGKVLINHKTHYSHCFRTKGDVFGFPYTQSGRECQRTKQRVKDMIWNKKCPGQIYPVSWLVSRFFPVKGWDEKSLKELKEYESGKHR
jgi:hypothetical protein